MRTSVASISKKFISTFFAATLALGLVPAAAFAEPVDASSAASEEATENVVSDSPTSVEAEPTPDVSFSVGTELAPPDEEAEGEDIAQASGNDSSAMSIPAALERVNEDVALTTRTIAQAESTRSYFLAQTLESTRTVPIVSANLPLDTGTPEIVVEDNEASEEEGGEESDDPDSEGDPAPVAPNFNLGTEDGESGFGGNSVATTSTVVGSFHYLGMTFAVEPGGETVALMAVDYNQLPQEYIEKQIIVIPSAATHDGTDFYSVTRIADNAFASLTKETANAAYLGCEALLADEGVSAPAAFENCAGILVAGIPASVTTIGDEAFAGTDTLQYLVFAEGNPNYASYDGALYSADLTNLRLIPEGRVGTVRVASSATGAEPEVFSHCPLVTTLVADADSEAYRMLEGNEEMEASPISISTMNELREASDHSVVEGTIMALFAQSISSNVEDTFSIDAREDYAEQYPYPTFWEGPHTKTIVLTCGADEGYIRQAKFESPTSKKILDPPSNLKNGNKWDMTGPSYNDDYGLVDEDDNDGGTCYRAYCKLHQYWLKCVSYDYSSDVAVFAHSCPTGSSDPVRLGNVTWQINQSYLSGAYFGDLPQIVIDSNTTSVQVPEIFLDPGWYVDTYSWSVVARRISTGQVLNSDYMQSMCGLFPLYMQNIKDDPDVEWIFTAYPQKAANDTVYGSGGAFAQARRIASDCGADSDNICYIQYPSTDALTTSNSATFFTTGSWSGKGRAFNDNFGLLDFNAGSSPYRFFCNEHKQWLRASKLSTKFAANWNGYITNPLLQLSHTGRMMKNDGKALGNVYWNYWTDGTLATSPTFFVNETVESIPMAETSPMDGFALDHWELEIWDSATWDVIKGPISFSSLNNYVIPSDLKRYRSSSYVWYFVAHFARGYNTTWKFNNGDADQITFMPETASSPTIPSGFSPSTLPTRDGFIFRGWFTNANCSGESTSGWPTQNPGRTITYYAGWETRFDYYWISGGSAQDEQSVFSPGSAGGVSNDDPYTGVNHTTLRNPDGQSDPIGWALDHWSRSRTGDDLPVLPDVTVSAWDSSGINSLYPVWKTKVYIAYDYPGSPAGNRSLHATPVCYYTNGAAPTVSYTLPEAPSYTGYKFKNWKVNYDDPSFGSYCTTYNAGTNITLRGECTLVANWEADPTYTITWVLNNGQSDKTTTMSSSDSRLAFPTGYSLTGGPTRTGWIFDGWYDNGYTNKLTTDNNPKTNAKYYARWRIDFNWYGWGSKYNHLTTSVYSPGDYDASTSYTAVRAKSQSTFSQDGWYLLGWQRTEGKPSIDWWSAEGGLVPAYSDTGINDLYGLWQCTVYGYENMPGDPNTSTEWFDFWEIEIAGDPTPGVTFELPSAPDIPEGYSFEGWKIVYDDEAALGTDDFIYSPNIDVYMSVLGDGKIIGQWERYAYKTTWVLNNGEDDMISYTPVDAAKLVFPQELTNSNSSGSTWLKAPEREGWIHDGWYDSTYKRRYFQSGFSPSNPKQDMVYYARWRVGFSFEFESDNFISGYGFSPDQYDISTRTDEVSCTAPTMEDVTDCAGWEKQGWVDSEGVLVSPGEKVYAKKANNGYEPSWSAQVKTNYNYPGGNSKPALYTTMKTSGVWPGKGTIDLPNNPSWGSYTFKGWKVEYDDSSLGTESTLYKKSTNLTTLTLKGACTLVAQWEQGAATVYWEYYDGSTGGSTSQPVTGSIVYPAGYSYNKGPEREGWYFTGWYLGEASKPTSKQLWSSTTPQELFNAGGVVHASYRMDFSFWSYGRNPDGSTYSSDEITDVDSINDWIRGNQYMDTMDFTTVTVNSDREAYYKPAGWTTYGWSTNEYEQENVVECGKPVAAYNKTGQNDFYPVWNAQVKTSYNYPGGNSNPALFTTMEAMGPNPTATVALPNNPSFSGYTFTGWKVVYEDASLGTDETLYKKNIDEDVELKGACTLVAQWEEEGYATTWVYNNGQSDDMTTTPKTAAAPVIPSAYAADKLPTREGWLFQGWYSDPDCKSQASNSDSWPKTNPGKAMTYYALWRIDFLWVPWGDGAGADEDCWYSPGDIDATVSYKDVTYPTPMAIYDTPAGWNLYQWSQAATSPQGFVKKGERIPAYSKDGVNIYWAVWDGDIYLNNNYPGQSSASTHWQWLTDMGKTPRNYVAVPDDPAPIPGYTFQGWKLEYDDSALGVDDTLYLKSLISPIEVKGSGTFYAQWEEDVTHTTTWVLNNGEENKTSSTAEAAEYLVFPQGYSLDGGPTRTGWIFDGWYTDETYATRLNSNLNPGEDATYYARWRIDFNWYFLDSDHGCTTTFKYSPGDYSVTTAWTDVEAQNQAPTPDFSITGWNWNYYWFDAYGQWRDDGGAYRDTGSQDYYGAWQCQIKEDYYLPDGTQKLWSTCDIDANGYPLVGTYKFGSRLGSPLAKGYNFLGWKVVYTDKEFGIDETIYNIGDTAEIKGASELVAQWEPHYYGINYDYNGGVGTAYEDDTRSYEDTLSLKSVTPTKKGYTLKGWTYRDITLPASTESYPMSSIITDEANGAKIIFVADWEPIEYTIELDLNDQIGDIRATCDQTSITVRYNNNVVLPRPEREGYTFRGWYDNASGGGSNRYEAGKAYSALTFAQDDGAVVTLYASWDAGESEIAFDSNIGENTFLDSFDQRIEYTTGDLDAFDPKLILSTTDGYKFAGYFDEDGKQYFASDGAKTTEYWDKPDGATLYAHWQYRIYFDKNADDATATLPEGERQDDGTVKVTLTGGTGAETLVIHDYDSDRPYIWATWHGKKDGIAYPTVCLPNASRENYLPLSYWTYADDAEPLAAGAALEDQNVLADHLSVDSDGIRSITLTADWKSAAARYDVRLVAQTSFPGSDGLDRIEEVDVADGYTALLEDVPYGSPLGESLADAFPITVPIPNAEQHVSFAGYYGVKDASAMDVCYIDRFGDATDHIFDRSTLVDGAVELYARWEVATYNVSFALTDADEGEDAKAPIGLAAIPYGSALPELMWAPGVPEQKVPQRAGYEFTGYYDAAGNRYYLSDLSVNPECATWRSAYNDTTLHAGWAPVSYEICWMYNYTEDGEDKGAYDTGYQTFGAELTLPEGTPSRPGFDRFLGWFTEPEGGEEVMAGAAFYPQSTEAGAITYYYAHYGDAESYWVKLFAGDGGRFATNDSAYQPTESRYAFGGDEELPIITAGSNERIELDPVEQSLAARLADYAFAGWREVDGSWSSNNEGADSFQSVAETRSDSVYESDTTLPSGEKRLAGTLVDDTIPGGIMGNRSFEAVWVSSPVAITLKLGATSTDGLEGLARPAFNEDVVASCGFELVEGTGDVHTSWASPYTALDLSDIASCVGYHLVGFVEEGHANDDDAVGQAVSSITASRERTAGSWVGTYVAVWEPLPYTVVFHANYGHTGEASASDITRVYAFDGEVVFPYPTTPFQAGSEGAEGEQTSYDSYAFKWWGLDKQELNKDHEAWKADESVLMYELLKERGDMTDQTLHLYAQWLAQPVNVTVPLFVTLAVDAAADDAEVIVADWDVTDEADEAFLGLQSRSGQSFRVHSVACDIVNEFAGRALVTESGKDSLDEGSLYLTVTSGRDNGATLKFDLSKTEDASFIDDKTALPDGSGTFDADAHGFVAYSTDLTAYPRVPLRFGLEYGNGKKATDFDFADSLVADDVTSRGNLARIFYTIEAVL